MHFYKYHGTGNDFILFDNRSNTIQFQQQEVALLCHRRFGIGADGLMLLEETEGFDFKMVYYNSDGRESSMCGNGGRCIVAFAKKLGIAKSEVRFMATDGEHRARLENDQVHLKMNDVMSIEIGEGYYFLNTGSPHYVKYVKDLHSFPVFAEGRSIRNNERFKAEGTNVNFIEPKGKSLFVRTYERGVEDETYSCGTGVTAAALVAAISGKSTSPSSCAIETLGGALAVNFNRQSDQYFNNIWLNGPATFVYEGNIDLKF